MPILLYNSLSRKTELFSPLNEDCITVYCCGMTVYNTPHIGNARPAIVFDVLYRLLDLHYGHYRVKYVRNFTDIDDKIIDRAKANGETITELCERTIADYHGIMDQLNCLQPSEEPRATEYIAEMIKQIMQLIDCGHAYVSEQQVLFDNASWNAHGKLTGHKQEDLESHRTIKGNDLKRSPGDFVLWKPSSDDQPGWESPWGRGRPGWHIECSSMISEIFKSQTIDIHGGGADLRFPHHECEISQFECANRTPLANYWMHNGLITLNGQKMAKSTGNFLTVADAIASGADPAAIRLFMLMTHYRSTLDWTDKGLAQATQVLTGWHRALEMVPTGARHNSHSERILEPLNNDLNTPETITRIHAAMTNIASDPEEIARGVRFAAGVLGIYLYEHDQYLRGLSNRDQIEKLVQDRLAARSIRDWKESDRIRAMLNDMGIVIEDSGGSTSWRRA